MKNKFEALKAFQSWPREWQELCAECWAENEDPDQQCFGANLEVAKIPTTIRNPFDCIDQGEMKLGALLAIGDSVPYDRSRKVRKQRAARVQPMKPWSMADDEALVKLYDTGIRRSQIIMRFMADHPYRTFNAVASRHDHLRRLDWTVQ
jgi:hypothetical protein